jgi:myo-inositol 2-dehydrogenase / D-chiro-inositol 1-dehydrogenase
MPPNQRVPINDCCSDGSSDDGEKSKIRCAVLGCGMMGQEHCSYLLGFPDDVSIDFLCDPNEPSLENCSAVIQKFRATADVSPIKLKSELELYEYANQIDLLVIATPNYQHSDTLLRWGQQNLTILLEKPVAVSPEQLDRLRSVSQRMIARVWVAMEYRFIPAIAKLIDLLPTIGDIKMVTIRENRFPFLQKIGEWNRDRNKTGDSLVEKWYVGIDVTTLNGLTAATFLI